MCAWNVSVLDKEIMMRKVTFEIKRKMIQVAAFGYSNLYLGNFLEGRLYKGKWKSFCNPGMIMNAIAMFRENPEPTREEIKAYLAGNLCRCSGYEGQLRAMEAFIEYRKKGERS